jgi:hypothetical protein
VRDFACLLYLLSPLIVPGVVFLWIAIVGLRFYGAGRIRFSLRGIIINITIAAVLLGFIKWVSTQYYWQLNDVKALLAECPEIENVQILGNEDLWYEAEVVFFSVNGQSAQITIPHGAEKSEFRPIVEDALANLKSSN